MGIGTDNDDLQWMRRAIAEGRAAGQRQEVPVGAVIVRDGVLLAAAGNAAIAHNDPTAHAEILALRQACQVADNYRLSGATVYCTLEPCPMCAGALVHARVRKVVYAVRDPRTGACGSVFDVLNAPENLHRPLIEYGLMAEESTAMLQQFFQARRS